MTVPFCKKCLFAELDPEGIYASITERLALLPDEAKVPDEEYRRRLGICRSCSRLSSGTCTVCGCFVELRAAKKALSCPHEDDLWA